MGFQKDNFKIIYPYSDKYKNKSTSHQNNVKVNENNSLKVDIKLDDSPNKIKQKTNSVVNGDDVKVTEKLIKETAIDDYNTAFFDFEVFNDYICVTFMGFKDYIDEKTKQTEFNHLWTRYFEFEKEDLDLKNKVIEFVNWFQEAFKIYIFVAWNVRYDESILFAIVSSITHNKLIDNKFKRKSTSEVIGSFTTIFQNYELDGNKKSANERFFKSINLLSQNIVNRDKDNEEDYTISMRNLNYQGEFGLMRHANFFDTMNIYTEPVSLKVAAGQLGFNIKESNVPWDAPWTTREQRDEILSYNINDVDVLARVSFVYWPYFDVRKSMIKDFTPTDKSKLRNKNDSFFNLIYKKDLAQKDYSYNNENYVKLSLGKYYQNWLHDKEIFEKFQDKKITKEVYLKSLKGYNFVESITTRLRNLDVKPQYDMFEVIESLMKKYVKGEDESSREVIKVWDKIKSMKNFPFGFSPKNDFEPIIFQYRGMEVVVSLGGVHGSVNQLSITTKVDKNKRRTLVVMKDVESLYPTMMIKYGLQAHWLYNKYINMYVKENSKEHLELHQILPNLLSKRLVYKKNKDPRDKSAKVLINAAYGGTGASFSVLYDPISRNAISILGQMTLLILCEMIHKYVNFIQINTDGVNFEVKDGYTNEDVDRICDIWSEITGFKLEDTYVVDTYNFDVNNYVLNLLKFDKNGNQVMSLKNKGAYLSQYGVHPLSPRSQTVTIANGIIGDAITNYMVHKIPLRETIEKEKLAYKFATVVKISKSYPYILAKNSNTDESAGLESLNEKINRFFSVKNGKEYRKFNPKKNVTWEIAWKGLFETGVSYDIYKKFFMRIGGQFHENDKKFIKKEWLDEFKDIIDYKWDRKRYFINFKREALVEDWIAKKKELLKTKHTIECLFKRGKNGNLISPTKRGLRTVTFNFEFNESDEYYKIDKQVKLYRFVKNTEKIDTVEKLEAYLRENEGITNFDKTLLNNNIYDGMFYIYDGFVFKCESTSDVKDTYHKYMGEKISVLFGDSHAIYNESLYKNYKNNYKLQVEDSVTIDDLGIDIDYDAYEKAAINYIEKKAILIYLSFREKYPHLIIPDIDEAIAAGKIKIPRNELINSTSLIKRIDDIEKLEQSLYDENDTIAELSPEDIW